MSSETNAVKEGSILGSSEQAPTTKSKEEREHLEQVCDSFRQYATFTRCVRAGQSSRISNLPSTQRRFFPRSMMFGTVEAKAREEAMQEAELRNQYFFDSMLRHAGLPHSQDIVASSAAQNVSKGDSQNVDATQHVTWSTDDTIEKAYSVLKSVARDWSKDGAAERLMTYKPILDGIKRNVRSPEKELTRVLVPGAGVGRLALEIFSLGYEVQGNEFSLHMLLASDFILNGTLASKRFAISPWLHSSKNVCRADDPARKVLVPDIDPASAMAKEPKEGQDHHPEFSMAAGEFVSIYSKPEEHKKWNAVVCSFFLDTAPCLVEYLEVIHNLLDEGGILINFGPLHYHWSGPPFRPDDESFASYKSKNSRMDHRYLESVDLTWEDIREVLWRTGFEVIEENLGIKARYTADARSFMNSDYRCIYFAAKKSTPKPRTDAD